MCVCVCVCVCVYMCGACVSVCVCAYGVQLYVYGCCSTRAVVSLYLYSCIVAVWMRSHTKLCGTEISKRLYWR